VSESVFLPDLRAEIEIPADGTLSRVLFKDAQLRLVAFGFDAGEELTEHTSASAAIVQVVTGRIVLQASDTSHEMTSDSWLYLPPHAPHSLQALEPSVVLLTLIRPGG
jgi:quercetin dioxygenase-like cupin family protein